MVNVYFATMSLYKVVTHSSLQAALGWSGGRLLDRVFPAPAAVTGPGAIRELGWAALHASVVGLVGVNMVDILRRFDAIDPREQTSFLVFMATFISSQKKLYTRLHNLELYIEGMIGKGVVRPTSTEQSPNSAKTAGLVAQPKSLTVPPPHNAYTDSIHS
jgi:hypothetical protein